MTPMTPRVLLFGAIMAVVPAGGCDRSARSANELASLRLDVTAVTSLPTGSIRVCGAQTPAPSASTCIKDLSASTGSCPCFNAQDTIVIDGLCPTGKGGGGQWRFDYTVYTLPDCVASSALTGSAGTNPNNYICYDTRNLAAQAYPNASVDSLALGLNENRIVCSTETAGKLWGFEKCTVSSAKPSYAARYDCGCVVSGSACSCDSGLSPSDLSAECGFEASTCDIVCGPACMTSAECSDAKSCTLDQCVNGRCSNTSTCDDANDCTIDTCTSSGCVYTAIADGRPCGSDEIGGHCLTAGLCTFPCEDKKYIIAIDPDVASRSRLYLLIETGMNQGQLLLVGTMPVVLNALGMHPTKHILYAIQETGSRNLYQLRADGSYTDLGTVSGLSTSLDWWAGGFLHDGSFLLVSSDETLYPAVQPTVAWVNVDTRTVTATKRIAATTYLLVNYYPYIIDLAEHPTTNEVWVFSHTPEYLAVRMRGFGVLNLSATPITYSQRFRAADLGVSTTWVTGAAFFNQAGMGYFYGSDRTRTESGTPEQRYLDSFVTTNGTLTRILSGPTVEHSDGASCQWR